MVENQVILSLITRDCALTLKKIYYVHNSFQEDYFLFLPEFNLTINRFSQFSKNAKDHFKLIMVHPYIMVSGVIGEKNFEVTYGKIQEKRDQKRIQFFEKRLLELGFGTSFIEYKKTNEGRPIKVT